MGSIFCYFTNSAAWQGSENRKNRLFDRGFMFILIVIQYISDQQQYDLNNVEELKIMKNLMVTIKEVL